jgi:hypothetical protein
VVVEYCTNYVGSDGRYYTYMLDYIQYMLDIPLRACDVYAEEEETAEAE